MKSGFPNTGCPRRQPVIRCWRNNFIKASSVSLLPLPRIRDMTAERFALVKTSAMKLIARRCGKDFHQATNLFQPHVAHSAQLVPILLGVEIDRLAPPRCYPRLARQSFKFPDRARVIDELIPQPVIHLPLLLVQSPCWQAHRAKPSVRTASFPETHSNIQFFSFPH